MREKLTGLMVRSGQWQTIGATYVRRYLRTGDPAALAEALAMFRATAAATQGEESLLRATCLSNLGQALRASFERTADPDALHEALEVSRAAVAIPGKHRRRRAVMLSNLAMVLRSDFERTGELRVAREAVEVSRSAAEDADRRHPNRARFLSNLAAAQFDLFGRTGDLDLLREAVAASRAAVTATRLRRGHRAMFRSNLGIALQELFEYTGDLDVLREAVSVSRAAVAATPGGHTQRAIRLSNLGLTLFALAERTGDVGLLREAVTVVRSAAAVAVSDADRARILSNLGIARQELFEYTGDLGTLREAVAAGQAAVAATPGDSPWRASYQSNLGISLQAQFDRTGDVDALRQAVAAGRTAVDATPAAHPDAARRLGNLGTALNALAAQTGDPDTVNEAVATCRAAAAAVPAGHRFQGFCLSGLVTALRRLAAQTGELDVLREAVAVGRAAVAAVHDDHPGQADGLVNLGGALRTLSERTGDPNLLSEARQALARAAGSSTAAVSTRIWAGSVQAHADTQAGDHQAALAAMEAVVGLLPRAASRELRRHDRTYRLGETPGIGAQAAACALSAGQPGRAVELLEQARELLMAEGMGVRGELARLRRDAPGLAAELTRLQDEIAVLDAAPAADLGAAMVSERDDATVAGLAPERDLGDRHRVAAAGWDALLARIRARPGLGDFLIAPPIGQLQRQAADGPVVIVTTDAYRCDALILTPDPDRPVRHVPLPDLTRHAAYEQATALLAARRRASAGAAVADTQEAQRDLHRILGWVWDTTAEPILTALDYTSTPGPGQAWPRLWWCPVGVMAFLPLHAAGHHDDVAAGIAAPRTVLDRVVSSYTATVRVLGYARQASPIATGPLTTGPPTTGPPTTGPPAAGHRKTLVVAMPETPGADRLPGVRAETRELSRLMPVRLLEGAEATRDRVLAALPAHPVAHFACHAVSGGSGGRLVVYDDASAPLTLAAISRLSLPDADLAYLSACGTTSPDVSDETLHVTAACQLAGYRNVVGTRWPVDDKSAARIAAEVYAQLTGDGTHPPATKESAAALHHALRRLRTESPQAPTRWTAHIHTGI